jgi:hypothetical protein
MNDLDDSRGLDPFPQMPDRNKARSECQDGPQRLIQNGRVNELGEAQGGDDGK